MLNLIRQLYDTYLDTNKRNIRKEIKKMILSMDESIILIDKLYKEIKRKYKHDEASGFFIDALALSLQQHSYIEHTYKYRDKEKPFIVIRESVYGTDKRPTDDCRSFIFKKAKVEILNKKFSMRNMHYIMDIVYNFTDEVKNQDSVIFMNLNREYKFREMEFYQSEEFKSYNNDLLMLNESIKKSIKLYSFVLLLCEEKVDTNSMKEFVNEFKDTKEIFNTLFPIMFIHGNKFFLEFAKIAIDNGVTLDNKEMIKQLVEIEHIYWDVEYKYLFEKFENCLLDMIQKTEEMDFLDSVKLNVKLQNGLEKKENSNKVKKMKI